MDAVSKLSKEDLSEMAESLIYLTYLKRRITFAEEWLLFQKEMVLFGSKENTILNLN